MKGCELCPGTARVFCESDQASLCFECDGKVHGANFLVARHSRVLLCRTCQVPTPWKAAGPRLPPTVSVCDSCVGGRSKKNGDDEGESAARERVDEEDDDHQEEDVDDEEMEEDDDDDVDDDEEEEEEEEEEGEEQVVPLPPVASSSSSEEESTVGQRFNGNNNNNGILKRNRWGNVDLPSSSCNQDQLPCSSSSCPSYLPNPNPNPNRSYRTAQTMADDDEATSDSFRPSKDRKKSDLVRSGPHQLSAISFGSGRPPI